MSLDRFLNPRAIAIIGASPETGKIRGLLLSMLKSNGYEGALYPINPGHDEIAGLRCWPSVAAVEKPIDLALIAIPAEGVPAALEECAAAGIPYAAIISSGFAEQGGVGDRLQAAIAAIVRRTGIRVCGPNAEGFHNEIARVAATFSPTVELKPGVIPWNAGGGRVGVIAQSGGMGFSFYNRGRALGLAFSQIISTGNEVDLSLSDFFAHMVADPDTDVVLLFLEGLRDPGRFLAAAAAARKQVIVVKVGRSEVGARASASHTASMSGWNTAYEAVFRKFGIIEARDPDEAVALAAAFTTSPRAKGKRVGIVTSSGGGGALVADALAHEGLAIPELSAPLQTALGAFFPAYGSARNPVDITAQAVHTGGIIRVVEGLAKSGEVDAIVIVGSLASESRVAIDGAALKAALGESGIPLLIYSYTIPSDLARRRLAEAGIIIQGSLSWLARSVRALASETPAPSRPKTLPRPPAVASALAAAGGTLAEHRAREILGAFGLAQSPYALVRGPEDLAAVTLGFPLALKIQSPDIPHKTEIGGVQLGLRDHRALVEAYGAMMEKIRHLRPKARIDGVLLQPMAKRGVEMIIGTVCDPQFGPLIMVGAGGVAAELARDTAWRLAPVEENEARAMIEELRVANLFQGFRGARPHDRASLVALIVRLSEFAAAFADRVREVELNPVMIHGEGEGCTILDALMTVKEID